jgi:hypothetical protein
MGIGENLWVDAPGARGWGRRLRRSAPRRVGFCGVSRLHSRGDGGSMAWERTGAAPPGARGRSPRRLNGAPARASGAGKQGAPPMGMGCIGCFFAGGEAKRRSGPRRVGPQSNRDPLGVGTRSSWDAGGLGRWGWGSQRRPGAPAREPSRLARVFRCLHQPSIFSRPPLLPAPGIFPFSRLRPPASSFSSIFHFSFFILNSLPPPNPRLPTPVSLERGSDRVREQVAGDLLGG